jgi:glycosyltransferase involved in cell wall biosynthesis
VNVQKLEGNRSKNILVITYGPVPTPEFQTIEGGGMRCWGLATGLRDNGHDVTVSVFNEFQQTLESHDGIHLHNWTLDDNFKSYINSFDVVVISYCLGDPAVFVAEKLSHHVTLVLDCYVPIYIEISARDSEDKVGELRGYLPEVERFNQVLKRGDFFLAANLPQKHMYMGILGSLGVINPYTYHYERVLLVPFGVDEGKIETKKSNPYDATNKDFVLLWFGGLYPWFNFEPLIKAVTELSKNPNFKFYLVGGKNPYNNHPDFVKQYDYVLGKFTELGLIGKNVKLVDWIDFDDRMRWFKNANMVISINSPGEENVYSWRTRVMDYLGGELPMISNGGDPLSDEIISSGAAVKTTGSAEDIIETVNKLIEKPSAVSELHKNLLEVKQRFYWNKVTKPLSDQLTSDEVLPYLDMLSFMDKNKIGGSSQIIKNLPRHLGKAQGYVVKAREKGIKRSARFAASAVKNQVKASSIGKLNKGSKAVFLSHPIDHTGAPLVLIDIINSFSAHVPPKNIHLVAPAIERDMLIPLLNRKYTIHKMAMGIGGRFIQAGLQINPDDFVLVNTVALYQNYKDYIYWMLETGKLKHAYWFIHEDQPETQFKNDREVNRIKRIVSNGKMTILVPSQQTAKEYKEFFDSDNVRPVTLKVQVPEKYEKPRQASDFETIKFFLSGRPLDGRKGQLMLLAALELFEKKYMAVNPDGYRPYSVDLLAIGDDYISEQIKLIGSTFLGKKLHIHSVVDREAALEITSKCNVTVCCSLNESFALYVAEGMLMGHPILRNKASGWQEQIKDGKNGFMIESETVEDLALAISKILSKKLTTEELAKMSVASQKIAAGFSAVDYYEEIITKAPKK